MDTKQIEDRVKKVVARVLGVDVEMITPDSHFVFDLGAESIQSVQLVAAFEAEFNIEMDNDAAVQVKTISGAVEFIGHYLKPRPAEAVAG